MRNTRRANIILRTLLAIPLALAATPMLGAAPMQALANDGVAALTGSANLAASSDSEGISINDEDDSIGIATADASSGRDDEMLVATLDAAHESVSLKPTDTEIMQKDISKAVVSGNKFTYDGRAHTPEEVTVKYGDTTLAEGIDYTVPSDVSITNAGSQSFTITGKGYYGGTCTATLAVTPRPVTVTPVASPKKKVYDAYKYSSLRVDPELSVTVKDSDGKTWDATPKGTIAVKNSSRKTVSSLASAGAGAYSLVVTLDKSADALETASYTDGNFTFTAGKQVKFKVTRASINPKKNRDAHITLATTMTYTGKAVKPKPVVKMYSTVKAKDSDDGMKHVYSATLTEGTDYKLSYKNNKKLGRAKVKITGKGNYKGSVTLKFTIKKVQSAHTTTSTSTHVVTRTVTNWKYPNTLWVKGLTKKVKEDKIAQKSVTVARPIKVAFERGKVSYRVTKWVTNKAKKHLKLNKNNGKVTVKKGTPKGTYKFKVKVTAKGDKYYSAMSKTVTCKIVVK